MRLRLAVLLLVAFFAVGCAGNPPKEVHNYGGFERDFQKGISEYHQVEYHFVRVVKDREVTVSEPFPLNEHMRLSENVKGISIGLHIMNAADQKYEIWEEYAMLYKEARYPYHIKRKLEESSLKERVLSINLPFEAETFYSFRVKVYDEKGKSLFTIGDVRYSTSKTRKK